MKKAHLLLLLTLSMPCLLCAQEVRSVTITVIQTPASHPGEALFLACPLNGWNPGSPDYILYPNHSGHPSITLSRPASSEQTLEFKITRGDWSRSECSPTGRLGEPRRVDWSGAETVECVVEGWRDDFPSSTASPNVHLVSEEFPLPQLGRTGRVCVYLPADYSSSGKRYPVIYLQDGQHIFDERTSTGRMGPIEWGVDEFLDSTPQDLIIVGIDHHPDPAERIAEYLFHPGAGCTKPRGNAYLAFLTDTLKPFIDGRYRTSPGPESTAVAGSSMGGMFSLYAGIRRPDIFGFVGVLSPSLWSDDNYLEEELGALSRSGKLSKQQYFFYAGGRETRRLPDGRQVDMAGDARRAAHRLQRLPGVEVTLDINPEGRHNALSWRSVFPKLAAQFGASRI